METGRAIIYIDPSLPGQQAMKAYFSNRFQVLEQPLPIEDMPHNYAEVRYAHDVRVPASLSPLERFNGQCQSGWAAKTVFLSWYSWRDHYALFSPYFSPNKAYLWNKRICVHSQLPCAYPALELSIQQLIKQ